ncbi:hypothetical protein JCM11641_006688 [Rhodosporidiobolus odoratus]
MTARPHSICRPPRQSPAAVLTLRPASLSVRGRHSSISLTQERPTGRTTKLLLTTSTTRSLAPAELEASLQETNREAVARWRGIGQGVARFELFFDLVFVGIIHVLAERAAEETSRWSIFKFSVRTFVNVSGTDDVPQRLYVLLVMALLLGFSANASAITIECASSNVGGGEASAGEASKPGVGEHSSPTERLFKRAGDRLGDPVDLGGGCELAKGWAKNIRGALAFYLVGKLVRTFLLVFYGTWLPRFRTAHFVRAVALVVSAIWWLPLTVVVDTPVVFLVLPIVAISLELIACMHSFVPAINIEHAIERTHLFIIIVLGEMILNVTFSATGSEAGIHLEYLRCVLGLILAYCLNWIYADADGSRTFLHALRRHWASAVSWQQLHFPLSAALILVSVAIASLVKDDEPSQGTRWLFGAGLAVVTSVLTFLGVLSKPLDRAHSALLHRNIRLLTRLIAGIIFAVLPLTDTLSSTELLAVVVGVLVLICVAETVGKLGSMEDEGKVRRALSARTEESEPAQDALHRELGGVHVAGVEEGPYELTDIEKGEDDAGVEGDLGEIRVTKLGRQQRLAYAF